MPNQIRKAKMTIIDSPHILGTLGPFLRSQKSTLYKENIREIQVAASGMEIQYLEQPPTNLEEAIENSEVIVTLGLGPDALAMAKSLKWLHLTAAGVEFNMYPEIIESSVTVTSAKGNAGTPMAEWAMMQIYMWNKQIIRYIQAQASKEWTTGHQQELTGMTVGIIGLGNSGADLARKCKSAHMTVLGLRRSGAHCPFVDEMFDRDGLMEFLTRSDFVCVTAPRTPETQNLLGEAEFSAMKQTAYLIVTSRGGIAQDDALLKALREGWIAGASLDAHTKEPLPPNSPFWDAPNTLISPHTAASGNFNSQRSMNMFISNVRRYVRGETLMQLVDKKAGY